MNNIIEDNLTELTDIASKKQVLDNFQEQKYNQLLIENESNRKRK